jgi:hypothetical protein
MSPTNDDIVEFARIGGISLIASFAASVYDRTAFAAFFACVGGTRLRRPSTSRGAVANKSDPTILSPRRSAKSKPARDGCGIARSDYLRAPYVGVYNRSDEAVL